MSPKEPQETAQGWNVRSSLGKYHLQVTARDVADVVESAGGWLFDRAMAGWQVTVVLSRGGDTLPLRILGVSTGTPEAEEDSAAPLRTSSMAVSAAAIADDETVRDAVLRTLKRGHTEVTIWGDAGGHLIKGGESVDHALSAAALAFKARALLAVGSTERAAPTETFRSRTASLPEGYSDLTPSVANALAHR